MRANRGAAAAGAVALKGWAPDPVYGGMPLVELRNVSKIYHLGGEEIRALDDVSLDIEAGEFKNDTAIHHTHEGSIGHPANKEIRMQMEKVLNSFPFKQVETAIGNLLK